MITDKKAKAIDKLRKLIPTGRMIYFVSHTDTTVSVLIPTLDYGTLAITDLTEWVAAACGYRMRKRGFSLPSGHGFNRYADVAETLALTLGVKIKHDRVTL